MNAYQYIGILMVQMGVVRVAGRVRQIAEQASENYAKRSEVAQFLIRPLKLHWLMTPAQA